MKLKFSIITLNPFRTTTSDIMSAFHATAKALQAHADNSGIAADRLDARMYKMREKRNEHHNEVDAARDALSRINLLIGGKK